MSKKEEKEREEKDNREHLVYPPSEDIYNQAEEVQNIDVDDLSQLKSPNVPADAANETDFEHDHTGSDLDVPGSDEDEPPLNGKEDEENDLYSPADTR
ncbi:MAG: hypothetical protein U0T73_13460 [Chitinophagales bacterium]